MAEKAGRRHSESDVKIGRTAKAKARDIIAHLDELGFEDEPAETDAPQKADGVEAEAAAIIWGYVKAAADAGGEWALDVLANPYGGPDNGRDADGQYFSPQTKFHEDKIPLPPVVYYHGYGDNQKPMGTPEFIGRTIKRWADSKGVWYRVVLDKANEYARRVWDAAKSGAARASSGVVLATMRFNARTGEITSWLNGEVSIFETTSGKKPANSYAVAVPAMKAVYQQAGIALPEITDDGAATGEQQRGAESETSNSEDTNMDESKVSEIVASALKAEREAVAAAQKAQVERQAEIDAAVKTALEGAEKAQSEGRRLPFDGSAPAQAKYGDLRKYDNMEASDIALMAEVLGVQAQAGRSRGPSPAALKALAVRLTESKEGEQDVYKVAASAFKATGLKANELNYSTQASYGDEWVGVAYSTRIWEAIRQGTFVGQRLMGSAIEIPAGHESMVLPLEGADPIFYKVGQSTAVDATMGIPVASVPSSKVGTGQATLTLAKMGARTVWSGEMEEDSLIPFVAQLRAQLERGGAETLEHVLIDGDTATGATTNINDIGGTPAGTEAFLLVNGFRKSCLVTTVANSRSAGTLTGEDFLETVKLMGLAGRNADKRYTEFILDLWTAWKALELPEVKTRDVFAQPTLENGELTGIYGYKVNKSAFMHFANQDATYGLKANTAGKLDLDTAANNTTGSILAVRWDQWQFGMRRRMTIETQRIPQADATQIVALMRFGLTQRDTEASAISYGVTL